ncbi:transglutaminase domain-containing protein [Wenxinia marina]|uniref:Transglutaminase-like enzyme, putative cysteine protease n=1 Tax=Wenxinia marina DSM 24838 TaxID=1123501 RepID=A0A0D0QA34_9RHOB|nr:transglutaminase domain-containing protein [Wenxinia marina]KIQ71314.1 Transglutaminase-like enzyme, putative cysteine protease [Wenxinia marina DSM 24838]GGL73823.1 transglutaminase [Wenxinia marina]
MDHATLYDISLRIAYAYDAPAAASRAVLRMLPLTGPGQQLVTGFVDARPGPAVRRDGRDFWGNATVEIGYDTALEEVEFRFDGRVRRQRPDDGLDLSCGLSQLASELAAAQSLHPLSPQHFIGTSPRVVPVPEIAAFARAATVESGSTLAAVRALSAALHGEFTFDPEATDVTTDPAEAFRNRRGVCQDISHVMIAGLRGIGVPAGYVSGFLRTDPPPGQPRLEGTDAMHAWVRAWCGAETGWVEIDPTNDMLAGVDHVAVAVGRDYSDVSPVRGTLRSAGTHTTEHRVDVVPVG